MNNLIAPEKKDVRLQIVDHLEVKGITQIWVARQIPCSTQHLSEVLRCLRPLTKSKLDKINEVLGTDFQADPPQINHEMRATG